MVQFFIMLSSSLFEIYQKSNFGQTINFKEKTWFEKFKFILSFNVSGVIRAFMFEVFTSLIKPFLMELPAYLIQVSILIITCGRCKLNTLERVKSWIEINISEGIFGFDKQIRETFITQDKIINFMFIDCSILIINIFASNKIFFDIPELRET